MLIGDAAHATTPHIAYGAGMAIEDSVVLAQELSRSDSVETAFDAFMARRFDRCKLVVETSLQLSEWEFDPPGDPSSTSSWSDGPSGRSPSPSDRRRSRSASAGSPAPTGSVPRLRTPCAAAASTSTRSRASDR